MSKPTLYHATAASKDENGNYTRLPDSLKPRSQHTYTGKDGVYTFAGTNLVAALTYSLKRSDDPAVAEADSSGFIDPAGMMPYVIMGTNTYPEELEVVADGKTETRTVTRDVNRKFRTHPFGAIFKVPNESYEPVLRKGQTDASQASEWVTGKSWDEIIEDVCTNPPDTKMQKEELMDRAKKLVHARMRTREKGWSEVRKWLPKIKEGWKDVDQSDEANEVDLKLIGFLEEEEEKVSAVKGIELVKVVTDNDQIMKYGVQIFLDQDRDTYYRAQKAFYKSLDDRRAEGENFDTTTEALLFFQEQIKNGTLLHLNAEKGINPLNFETGELADNKYVKNPDLILDPALEVKKAEAKTLKSPPQAHLLDHSAL